ncbi:hypothetical protein DNTS_029097 [Danionella cerebrum]|uniref:Uncharacterized protein n=1 Tax=Danionella cerebrum TaxID=2873325 RepID=A0A553PJ56_9TELE|nr:hypothetical protein DNTS_029097 [Danionella translucida]
MVRPRTLNELGHLRDTEFGQPHPRHGLSLLWWFAHECIEIDGEGKIISKCDPKKGDFGFHPFKNKEHILPNIDLQYYEVGNLNRTDDLPYQVTRYHENNEHIRESNADRIIVAFDSNRRRKWFPRVYVSHHLGLGLFDENATFRISQGLLVTIRGKDRSDFINQVKI